MQYMYTPVKRMFVSSSMGCTHYNFEYVPFAPLTLLLYFRAMLDVSPQAVCSCECPSQ